MWTQSGERGAAARRSRCQHSVGEVLSTRRRCSHRAQRTFLKPPLSSCARASPRGQPRLFTSSLSPKSPPYFLSFFFLVYVYISVHSEATISIFKKRIARQVFSYRCVMHTYSLTHALSSLVQVLLVSSGGWWSGHAGVSGERGSSRPKGQRSRCWSVVSGEDLVQLPSPSIFRLLVRF